LRRRPRAASCTLARSGGEPLPVTKDASAPYGILINGAPIALGNQATPDKKVALHLVDGNMIPPSSRGQVATWRAGSTKSSGGAAAAKVGGFPDAPAAVMDAAKESAKVASGARTAAASTAAAAAGAAAALALLL
jgi:hypothetical protein